MAGSVPGGGVIGPGEINSIACESVTPVGLARNGNGQTDPGGIEFAYCRQCPAWTRWHLRSPAGAAAPPAMAADEGYQTGNRPTDQGKCCFLECFLVRFLEYFFKHCYYLAPLFKPKGLHKNQKGFNKNLLPVHLVQ